PQGVVEDIRLAWGSVGPTVVACTEAEDLIRGNPLKPETLEEAANLVRESVTPIDDVRAGAEYRRIATGNLLLRLILHRPSTP
ncbi:MAG: hypothetical protein RDU20_14970, partial [Desulfomonilaceae bacterium]|nr:hypothetical protein [Desulfomonilaceae bacterium]